MKITEVFLSDVEKLPLHSVLVLPENKKFSSCFIVGQNPLRLWWAASLAQALFDLEMDDESGWEPTPYTSVELRDKMLNLKIPNHTFNPVLFNQIDENDLWE